MEKSPPLFEEFAAFLKALFVFANYWVIVGLYVIYYCKKCLDLAVPLRDNKKDYSWLFLAVLSSLEVVGKSYSFFEYKLKLSKFYFSTVLSFRLREN